LDDERGLRARAGVRVHLSRVSTRAGAQAVKLGATALDDQRASALPLGPLLKWREEQERGWRLRSLSAVSRAGRRWVWSSASTAPRLNRRLPLWVESPAKLLATGPRAPSNVDGREPTQALSDRCHGIRTLSMFVRGLKSTAQTKLPKRRKALVCRALRCAQGDSNSHPAYTGQGPQPCGRGVRTVRSRTLRPFCPPAWLSWTYRTECPLPACCHGDRAPAFGGRAQGLPHSPAEREPAPDRSALPDLVPRRHLILGYGGARNLGSIVFHLAMAGGSGSGEEPPGSVPKALSRPGTSGNARPRPVCP
jgi:hypothetical protein